MRKTIKSTHLSLLDNTFKCHIYDVYFLSISMEVQLMVNSENYYLSAITIFSELLFKYTISILFSLQKICLHLVTKHFHDKCDKKTGSLLKYIMTYILHYPSKYQISTNINKQYS